MDPHVRTAAASTAPRGASDGRGAKRTGGSVGAIVLLMIGMTTAIYALSPGVRHFYKHGRLPDGR